MRFILTTLLFLIGINLYSQELDVSYEAVKLIEPRSIYLNGGVRASMGGKSRERIKIDLPENTVKWYYSFSTSKGESGTKNLNLAIQMAPLLSGVTTLPTNLIGRLKVPEGSSMADVYILPDFYNSTLFIQKSDLNGGTYNYYVEGSVQNTIQGKIEVDDVNKGTVYLGLRNPSELDAVNISIEAVAIVKKVEVPEELKKAELFGNMGWKKFEAGEYEKCIEYSDKSISYYELGWVVANKALAQLVLGDELVATETYIHALTLVKDQRNSKQVLKAMVNDLKKAKKNHSELSGVDDLIDLIKMEM